MIKLGNQFSRHSKAFAATVLIAAIGAGGFAAAGLGGSPSVAQAEVPGEAKVPAASCSGYRWNVKTLTDPGAGAVGFSPRDTTIGAIRSLPSQQKPGQRVAPYETQTWRLSNVQITGMRYQADGDLHLVAADQSGGTIDVELPNPRCTTGAPPALRAQMDAARQAVLATYGDGAGRGFHPLKATATLTGVGFYDFQHKGAGPGAAPTGVELHPVLSFTKG